MKKETILFFLIFVFAAFVFLAHYWVVGSAVWGDGRYYYSYLRSAVIDSDLDLENEFVALGMPVEKTTTGMVVNQYSIGPAIFWLPFFLLAHGISLLLRGIGFFVLPDGYSHLYQIIVGLGAVFYGVGGLWVSFLLARQYFSSKVALVSVLGIWLASNLFFYTAVDPVNSHAVSFFVASLLVFLWDRYFSSVSFKRLAILGLLTGVSGMTRAQDLLYGLIWLIWALTTSDGGPAKPGLLRGKVVGLTVFVLAIFLAMLPQLYLWRLFFGQLNSPYLVLGNTFDFLHPRILAVLFSANNGLFTYSPILIIGLIGLIGLVGKKPMISFAGLGLFALQTYLIGSWSVWWGGAAYGGRMFISLMPFFIMGLATLVSRLGGWRQIFIYPVLLILVGNNFLGIISFLLADL